MIYAVIDTNVFVRVWSQGKPGCEIEHLHKLSVLAQRKAVRILLPEVIQLEIGKKWRTFPQDLGNKFALAERAVTTPLADLASQGKLWSEIYDLQASVATFLQNWKDQKAKECQARYDQIQKLLASSFVDRIPLSPEIMLSAKRRQISGNIPSDGPRSENDALIVESVLSFLKMQKGKRQTVFFCSENTKDFALEVEKTGHTLHPTIKADLKAAILFLDLSSLVSAIAHEKLPAQPKREDVEKALDREWAQKEVANLMSEALGGGSSAIPMSGLAQVARAISDSSRISIADAIRVTTPPCMPVSVVAEALRAISPPPIIGIAGAMRAITPPSIPVSVVAEALRAISLPPIIGIAEGMRAVTSPSNPISAMADTLRAISPRALIDIAKVTREVTPPSVPLSAVVDCLQERQGGARSP